MVKEVVSKLSTLIFREQKVRLQVEWFTHTDEMILELLAEQDEADPETMAAELERSEEYVADRARQLALNGLLERIEEPNESTVRYRIAEFGERYLAGDVDAEELKLEDEE